MLVVSSSTVTRHRPAARPTFPRVLRYLFYEEAMLHSFVRLERRCVLVIREHAFVTSIIPFRFSKHRCQKQMVCPSPKRPMADRAKRGLCCPRSHAGVNSRFHDNPCGSNKYCMCCKFRAQLRPALGLLLKLVGCWKSRG